jgi:CRISPR-associated protein (TIGR02710 family)
MRRILQGHETYGEGTPSEQATAFKLAEMLPAIVDHARRNSQVREWPSVDLLVSLSGFSPATTVLAYELLKPRALFILSSEGTDRSIDVIHQYVVQPGRLAPRQFGHKVCDGTDPYEIYRRVKEELEPARPGVERPSAMIDITGGKKVMSAAAGLAAWRLDLRLCYLDGDYDPDLQQPRPGSERLLILENPTTLFGDDEMGAALQTFRSGTYAEAQARFGQLADSISEPRRARFLRDLAGVYQAFSDFDLENLPPRIGRARRSLADVGFGVDQLTAERIRQQFAHLEDLAGRGDLLRFLPSFFVLGQHYHELRRLDFAALLYYRTAEGCFQQRLALGYSGFDCGDADYARLPVPEDELRVRVNQVYQRLHRATVTALPTKLGFFDAAVVLHALDDEMLRRISITDERGLSHLSELSEARNKSLLAHGDRRVTDGQVTRLAGEVRAILRALWRLHQPSEDIDQLCDTLRFVRDL